MIEIYIRFAIGGGVFGLDEFDVARKAERAEFVATIFQPLNETHRSRFGAQQFLELPCEKCHRTRPHEYAGETVELGFGDAGEQRVNDLEKTKVSKREGIHVAMNRRRRRKSRAAGPIAQRSNCATAWW